MAERRRRRPDLGDAATGLSGEGQGVGANRGDEGNAVDSSERRGKAWFGRNHAEAEAAMANSDEKKKGPRAPVVEEAWGEAGEARRDSGHA